MTAKHMSDATLLKIVESLTAQLLEAESPECRVLVADEIAVSHRDVITSILLMLSEAIEPVFAAPAETRSLS